MKTNIIAIRIFCFLFCVGASMWTNLAAQTNSMAYSLSELELVSESDVAKNKEVAEKKGYKLLPMADPNIPLYNYAFFTDKGFWNIRFMRKGQANYQTPSKAEFDAIAKLLVSRGYKYTGSEEGVKEYKSAKYNMNMSVVKEDDGVSYWINVFPNK